MSDKKAQETKSIYVWKNLLAGGMAGGVEAAIMYPTEYVKTQLQLQSRSNKGGEMVRYRGVFHCGYTIAKEKGPLALYRGVSTLIIGSIPKAGVRFAAYSQFRHLLEDDSGKLTPFRTMMAGLGAGCMEAIIAVTPTETVKTKLIADQNSPHPRYKGLIDGVSRMIREEGIKGVYAGVVPTILKQSVNQASRFTVYEGIKKSITTGKLHSIGIGTEFGSLHAMMSGMIAGGVSVYVTMPFDVVKTRLQSLDAAQYKGTLDCLIRCVKEEGVLALWKGTTPRLGRVMCSGGITFTAYEAFMKILLSIVPDPVSKTTTTSATIKNR